MSVLRLSLLRIVLMYLPDGDTAVLENSGLKPSSMVCAAGGNAARRLELKKAIKSAVAEASPSLKFDRNFFISSISGVCLYFS